MVGHKGRVGTVKGQHKMQYDLGFPQDAGSRVCQKQALLDFSLCWQNSGLVQEINRKNRIPLKLRPRGCLSYLDLQLLQKVWHTDYCYGRLFQEHWLNQVDLRLRQIDNISKVVVITEKREITSPCQTRRQKGKINVDIRDTRRLGNLQIWDE